MEKKKETMTRASSFQDQLKTSIGEIFEDLGETIVYYAIGDSTGVSITAHVDSFGTETMETDFGEKEIDTVSFLILNDTSDGVVAPTIYAKVAIRSVTYVVTRIKETTPAFHRLEARLDDRIETTHGNLRMG